MMKSTGHMQAALSAFKCMGWKAVDYLQCDGEI
jgi:hypothetical protein